MFRRRPPKFDSQEFVRSTGQPSPIGWLFAPSVAPHFRFLAMIASSMARSARRSRDVRVITAVEPERLDPGEKTALRGAVQGGREEDRVVAVRPFYDPANGDPHSVDEDRPFPC